jgi:molybdopterin synthase sulfur carrier subunit
MLRVLFFASLREVLGCDHVMVPHVPDMEMLLKALGTRFGEKTTHCLHGENILIAHNQEICRGNISLEAGDEIAFLPPVSGG